MIVVTGATGSIGRELVKLMVATHTAARAVVRDPSKAQDLGIEVVKGDLSDPASLDKAFAGADHLFLLAATSPEQHKLHIHGIEAAKRAGFTHVVKLSAMGADPSSPLTLGRSHAQSDEVLRGSGVGWTILQPTSFAQNILGSLPTIKEGAIYGCAGEGKVPYIDVRDIARVAFATLTRPGYMGRTLPLTGGKAYSYAECAEAISKVIDKPVRYVDVPAEVLEQNLVKAGLPAWLAKDLATLETFARSGGAASIQPTVQEILRKPALTFEDFVRDHAQAFKG